ncbi:hypothetical protein F4805DRAFT_408977 [Annulohypoxylon moriforme]|nr:hypothetical protein F4805DRAFT_408977 [Annulohypoxylon moriforme]
MLGRLLLTIDALCQTGGALFFDYFSESHMFNPRWPPHAKFHNVQTVALAIILSSLTLYYTWRPARTRELKREFMFMSAITGSIYWISGLLAILPPNTMGVDPEFGGPAFPQVRLFIPMIACGLIGAWLEY